MSVQDQSVYINNVLKKDMIRNNNYIAYGLLDGKEDDNKLMHLMAEKQFNRSQAQKKREKLGFGGFLWKLEIMRRNNENMGKKIEIWHCKR